MRNCFKLAIRLIKKSVFIREVMILLFMTVFAFVIFLVSAIKIKIKDYQVLSGFIKNKGVLVISMGLAKSADDGGLVIRDEEELAEYLGDTNDILCMEEVWATTANDETVYTYCYSRNVVNALDPIMKEGRWFDRQDPHSDSLKVVVSYNNGVFKTGDHIKLKSAMVEGIEQELEVIGVLEDDQLMFMGDTVREPYCDYRDCYRVISSKHEPVIKLFLSDEQLSSGAFPYLNFRTGPDKGFQKQMKNVTLIGFDKDIRDEDMMKKIDKIRSLSQVVGCNNLGDVREGSVRYITEELRLWLPLFIMLTVFVLVSLISVNVVMARKMMGYYAVYYLCGFTWKKNASVTLMATAIESVVALAIITGLAMASRIALAVGVAEVIACFAMALVLMIIAHISVLIQIGKTSAKEVFAVNGYRRLTW